MKTYRGRRWLNPPGVESGEYVMWSTRKWENINISEGPWIEAHFKIAGCRNISNLEFSCYQDDGSKMLRKVDVLIRELTKFKDHLRDMHHEEKETKFKDHLRDMHHEEKETVNDE